MNNNKQLLKRIITISSFMVMAALLLTACNGAFSFGGSVNPNDEGGVDVSGGAEPVAPAQPNETTTTGLSQTAIILIIVGVGLFILVLVLALTRGQSKSEPPT